MSTSLRITGIQDMPAEAYHADKRAWSRGMIADFRERRSVCHARHILHTAPPTESSAAMDLGTLTHAALLQPHLLRDDSRFVAFPDDLRSDDGGIRSKEAKDWKKTREKAGVIVLKDEQFHIAQKMVDSVKSSEVGKWLAHPAAKIEKSIYWIDVDTDIACRCRPDCLIIHGELALCIDVKTTGDVTPNQFRRRIEQCGLLLQDSHYSEGIATITGLEPRFLFAAVEAEWPHATAVYEIDPDQRSEGRYLRRQTMHEIADCLDTGDWSDKWADQINIVTLNKWALGA